MYQYAKIDENIRKTIASVGPQLVKNGINAKCKHISPTRNGKNPIEADFTFLVFNNKERLSTLRSKVVRIIDSVLKKEGFERGEDFGPFIIFKKKNITARIDIVVMETKYIGRNLLKGSKLSDKTIDIKGVEKLQKKTYAKKISSEYLKCKDKNPRETSYSCYVKVLKNTS